jgi:hypothetical protein
VCIRKEGGGIEIDRVEIEREVNNQREREIVEIHGGSEMEMLHAHDR